MSEDLIAGDVADVVPHNATVGRRDIASLPEYAGGTPERVAQEHAKQIEQVRTEHHHVLAASARVLFSERPDLDDVSDQPFRDSLL